MQQDPTAAAPETKVVEPSIFDLPEWTGAEVAPPVQDNAKFAGVRFQPVGKVYHYRADGFEDLKIGDRVIVETARGKQMGQITTLRPPRDRGLGFRRIERKANGRDLAMRHYYENKELEAMIAARAEVNDLGLPIKVARAEYAFDGSTLTFLYATHDDQAEVNVDPLGERLSHLYRARIELRQVGPREVAKIIGGMGACGIETRCCSKFLTEFSPISIKMAKEQGISLTPEEITGMCGRLRCCLIYEYEQYVEARKQLPKRNKRVVTPKGEGKVLDVLPMMNKVLVLIEGEEGKKFTETFDREDLQPWDELEALRRKSEAPCDRHDTGGCTCGKKSPMDRSN
jgi:cell fate regulator YaaT (PSP1 superfamily)